MPKEMTSEDDVLRTAGSVTGHIGFEEFTEDLFGLNIRSAKTIWQAFKSPRHYFSAAKTADWYQKYTPSLRLWLGIMTLMVALQFFWGKPDGTMMQAVESEMKRGLETGLRSSGATMSLENFDFRSVMVATMKLHTLIYPFIFVTMMSFLAFVYRAWGERLSYVVRQRYIFAVLIPASFIGLISTLLMTFLSSSTFQIVSYLQLVLILVFYFITAYRGPYVQMETGERVGRSIFLSLCILIMLITAQMISIVIALWIKVTPALRAFLEQANPPI